MSTRFSAGALKLAGLVPRALGWRPADFWKSTPAEVAAILAPEPGSGERPLTRTELNSLLERDCDG